MFDFLFSLFDNANIQLYFHLSSKNKKIFMLYVVKNQHFIKKVKKFFIRAPKIPHFFTPKQRQPQKFQNPAIQINIILSLLSYSFTLSSIYFHNLYIFSLYYCIFFYFLITCIFIILYYLICLLSYMFTILLFYFITYMIVYI